MELSTLAEGTDSIVCSPSFFNVTSWGIVQYVPTASILGLAVLAISIIGREKDVLNNPLSIQLFSTRNTCLCPSKLASKVVSHRTCTIRIIAAANATLIPSMLISVETPVFLNTFIA